MNTALICCNKLGRQASGKRQLETQYTIQLNQLEETYADILISKGSRNSVPLSALEIGFLSRALAHIPPMKGFQFHRDT